MSHAAVVNIIIAHDKLDNGYGYPKYIIRIGHTLLL